MKFIVQGYPAFAYTAGKPIKPEQRTIVFIHGAGMDHSVWQWQSRYFAYHGVNVLAVDLPAHGQSPGNIRTSIEKLADWIVALLDCTQVERASLVGHSMGSLIALDCAHRYGNRVDKLVLLGTAIPMPVGEAFLAETAANSHAGVMMQTVWGHAPASRLAQSPAPGSSMLGVTQALVERSEPGAQGAGLAACNAYSLTPEAIKQIEQPTLIITGQRDMMAPPKAGADLAKLLPNARVVSVNAGHSMMSEAPNAVLDALRLDL